MKLYRRLLAYLWPYAWPRGAAMVACMLCFSGIESAVPFVVRYAIERVLVAGDTALCRPSPSAWSSSRWCAESSTTRATISATGSGSAW